MLAKNNVDVYIGLCKLIYKIKVTQSVIFRMTEVRITTILKYHPSGRMSRAKSRGIN